MDPISLDIRQAETPAEIAAVIAMLRGYLTWALTLEEDSKAVPTFEGVDDELVTLPGVYAPPGGRLLLATWNGEPAGCIALKPHHGSTGELKRLYVAPPMRGHEIGRHLVERLVAEARVAGYRQLVLDSHHSMTRAHALYRGVGFRDVPPPADFPERFKAVAIFMELDL